MKVKLTDICRPKQWKIISMNQLLNDGYPVYGANGKIGYYSEHNHEKPVLLIGCRGSCGSLHITEPFSYANGNAMALDDLDDSKYLLKYLYYFFSNRGFVDVISGSSQPQITRTGLERVVLPVVPLKKQKQIVQILDTANNLRQKREEQLALLDDYLKSVFIEIFGDPIFNYKKWPLVELNSIIENIDSGWSPVCVDNHRESQDVPVVLKLGAVTYCVFNQLKYKIIPKDVDIKKRVEVQSKDLLFTRKNTKDLVGASVYVFKCERNLLLPDTIFRLNYKNTLVNGIYLWKLFTEKGFRKVIQNLATGSAGSMPNISKEKLKKLRMPLPSLNIQNKFASIVEQAQQIKQKMRASLDEMDNHFNALMQRYFE